jgi:hypothetical protein
MRAGDTRPLHSRWTSGASPAVPRPVRTLAPLALLLALALVAWAGAASAAGVVRSGNLGGRERDCAALIAYLEASVEGVRGMQAVVRVVHNRMRDARFASTACAVVGQDGQFQPMEERPALKRAVRGGRPLRLERLLRVDTPFERMLLGQALRLAGAAPEADPTKGALYFVNPLLMDPDRCPWFAALRRTTRIGAHVFMTHYHEGERRRGPALDCRIAGRDNWMIARNRRNLLLVAHARLARARRSARA